MVIFFLNFHMRIYFVEKGNLKKVFDGLIDSCNLNANEITKSQENLKIVLNEINSGFFFK